MALIMCPECSKEVSDKAKSCPNCGYKTKKVNVMRIVFCIIVLIVTASIVWFFASKFSYVELTEDEKIAVNATEHLLKSLKDPESLDLISIELMKEWSSSFGSDYDLVCRFKYRAKNGYGALDFGETYIVRKVGTLYLIIPEEDWGKKGLEKIYLKTETIIQFDEARIMKAVEKNKNSK